MGHRVHALATMDLGTPVEREKPAKKAKKRTLDPSAAPKTGCVGAAAGARAWAGRARGRGL